MSCDNRSHEEIGSHSLDYLRRLGRSSHGVGGVKSELASRNRTDRSY
jgi:hypothetical protein